MTTKKIIKEAGFLNEIFSPGGGEDVEYSLRIENLGYKLIQVPLKHDSYDDGEKIVGGFPIYHEGEKTVGENPKWNEIFKRNSEILKEKYNLQYKYGNHYERAVYDNYTRIGKREKTRYEWAKENLTGKNILEIGCSNGYGLMILPEDINYTGYDYSEDIIELAKKQFPQHKFKKFNLETDKIEGKWDTIIAFEVLEHLTNGKELAQELKKHCKTLLITTPYKERK